MCKAQGKLGLLSREVLIDLVIALSEELEVTDRLLEERNRVMEAIPPCPAHGCQCVPYALDWIERVKDGTEFLER